MKHLPSSPACRPARALTAMVATVVCAVAAGAQPITLPSIRLGGPPPEEERFFRVITSLRTVLAPDTLRLAADLRAAADAVQRGDGGDAAGRARAAQDTVRQVIALEAARVRARRYGPRLDELMLAALDGDQPDLLDSARTPDDTLRALAGKKYDEGSPAVAALQQALDAYVRRERRAGKRVGSPVATPRVREREARTLLRGALEDPTLGAEDQKQVQELSRLAVALVVLRKFDERDGVIPVRNRAQAEVFWGQQGFSTLNVGAFAANRNSATAFTELASPLLQTVRLSINAVLVAKSQTASPTSGGTAAPATPSAGDNDAAVQRLVTGGGLVNVAAAWPVVHFQDNANEKSVSLLAVPRLGFTAPQLGGQATDSTTLALDAGIELHAKVLDLVSGVGVIGQARYALATGSRRFGDNLGLASDRVRYATAGFGLAFDRRYMVTFSRVVGGPRAIRTPHWTVGLTAVRLPTLGGSS